MKIKYSNAVYTVAITGAGGVVFTDGDLWHGECISMGFTTDELNRAEANPGTWIECTRETDLRTEAFDAMLVACKAARTVIYSMCRPEHPQGPPMLSRLDDAIALAEKVKGE